jgi:hypothetical protein
MRPSRSSTRLAVPAFPDDMTVRVASIEDLIRMKRAAGRPKDLIEVEWLCAVRDEIAGPD